jgi:predicted ArsR family transcriptional regulator
MMTNNMTSRQRILDYLQTHPGATPGELARALRQTPANARHHLRGLERDGMVASTVRPKWGRGRPEKGFTLSERAQGDNFAALSGALLGAYLGSVPEPMRESALRGLADRLGPFPPAEPGTSLPRRLAAVVEALSGLHYQARWEARASGPQVILGHCPFRAIIARHPELCRMDAHLLETGLGVSVQQLEKLQPNERGLPVCVFALG